ncbi:MAG: hypothetical protein ABIY55_04360 [Kofleriaceae bacterium]
MRIFVEQAAICGSAPHARDVVPAWAAGVQARCTTHLRRLTGVPGSSRAVVAINRSHEKTTVSLEFADWYVSLALGVQAEN